MPAYLMRHRSLRRHLSSWARVRPLIAAILIALGCFPLAPIGVEAKGEQTVRLWSCIAERPSDEAPDERVNPKAVSEYLRIVAEQRADVAKATDTARQFLADPNSLDQRKRTRFLQALATLRTTADAAADLVPPSGLELLHQRHVETLAMLATIGDFYFAGLDAHDPTQYERANRALARGSELFTAVGEEIDRLLLPD